MKKLISILSLTCVANAYAEDTRLTEFGDIAQFALPAIGLGATYIYDDPEGRKQWLYTGLTAVGTTTVLKGIYAKVRPNFSETMTSFPSGHTTGAFFGAAFLDQRYGKSWGIPAYAAALLTAYSRIQSDNHFVDDTLMGASVSMMSSWLWTTPFDGNVALIPAYVEDGAGVQLFIKETSDHDHDGGLLDQPEWRYSIAFGPAWQDQNQITASSATGTTLDLDTFDKINNPTTTANAIIERFTGRHRFLFSLEPFEARDTGEVSRVTDIDNTRFLPGEALATSYRLTDVRLQYYYDLAPNSRAILEAGAGLAYQRIQFHIATQDNVKTAEVKSIEWLPLLNGLAGYQLTPRLSVLAEVSGLSLSDQDQLDANVHLDYRLNRYWNAGIGYAVYDMKRNTDTLQNGLKYKILMTYVGYSFF